MVTVEAKGYEGYYYRVKSRRPRNNREKDCYTLVCVNGPNKEYVGDDVVVQGSRLREADMGE